MYFVLLLGNGEFYITKKRLLNPHHQPFVKTVLRWLAARFETRGVNCVELAE
jgi:hypothetical protein